MQKRKRFLLLFPCGILFLWAGIAFGQNYSSTITVDDNGGNSATLTFGVNTGATYCKDVGLGEFGLPPKGPAGVFDARFVDIPSRTACMDQGQSLDLREFIASNQRDSFLISFQSSTEAGASNLTFSWPGGLSAFGGGYWHLVDPFGGSVLDIDMTLQTSASVPQSLSASGVYIISDDSVRYRTFTANEIATTVDGKGKSKSIKKKADKCHWRFTFTNATGGSVTGITVKYGMLTTSHVVISNGFTTSTALPAKEVVYTGSLGNNGALTIEGYGAKGKLNKAKGVWAPAGKVTGVAVFNNLLLPLPNLHNLGEEVYLQGGFGANGLEIGIAPKNVIHLKYKDILKTLNEKGTQHSHAPRCIDVFDTNGKPILKTQKGLKPGKHNNVLLANAVAFKFNIAASDKGKTPGGLGDLVWNDPASPLDGKSLDQIATQLDQVLSCDSAVKGGLGVMSYADWNAAIESVNNAFNDEFDTTGWAVKLTTAGTRPLSEVPYLQRVAGASPRIIPQGKSIGSSNPTEYALDQNYPNPFNPTTTISFHLAEDAFVSVMVYNMLGQEVARLADREEFTEGENEIEFDAASMASGVYYYRLIVNDGQFTQVRKMMLMK